LSVAARIADAVKAAVESLPETAGARVVVRKQPNRADGDPELVVVVTVTEDETEPFSFEDDDKVTYTAVVARAETTAGKLKDDGPARLWKQAVRRKLRHPALADVPEVIGAEIKSGSPFPRSGTDAAVNYTTVVAQYQCAETAPAGG